MHGALQCLLALVVCLSVDAGSTSRRRVSSNPHLLTKNVLRKQCPRDADSCHMKASRGWCQGISTGSLLQTLWDTCQCSCITAANHRMQLCCSGVGVPRQCRKLCNRDNTFEEYIDHIITFPECEAALPKVNYCAGEGVDARACCRQAGVPSKCTLVCDSSDNSASCVLGDDILTRALECRDQIPKIRVCLFKKIPFRPNTSRIAAWKPPC